ncbi:hypothetical protein AQS8620_00404 [Aquimixticola soesokkakensis]|uniref:DUF6473 domain-containing protein n=1 Tax=Aquimixticola soesokkakensis TaxID=1519096 RepID=A0A1Y5RN84_9RHOB|nr:DUF6473 family protein [Aquimixticola soesokkakensis]SLN18744.1 hypothetical protein AQS8620_00404 [Aquimixticola soesokkakensis]
MAFQNSGDSALNYVPCRYGKSKILFRGPAKALTAPYVAMIGGTETYGKFTQAPFPDLVDDQIDQTVVNLGCVNAGTDVFINDQSIADICTKAEVTVIQISGAHNMSNRFYAVHPRRNDRFLRSSTLLQTIYRDIDFTDFNFTRHLLGTLEKNSEEKFLMVRQELRDAWIARMKSMLTKIQGRVILLWLSDHSPDDFEATQAIGSDPVFVNREMLDALRPHVKDIVEVVATQKMIEAGYKELIYADLDAPAAQEMLGQVVHREVADKLAHAIKKLI